MKKSLEASAEMEEERAFRLTYFRPVPFRSTPLISIAILDHRSVALTLNNHVHVAVASSVFQTVYLNSGCNEKRSISVDETTRLILEFKLNGLTNDIGYLPFLFRLLWCGKLGWSGPNTT